jgi:hypothetical protein
MRTEEWGQRSGDRGVVTTVDRQPDAYFEARVGGSECSRLERWRQELTGNRALGFWFVILVSVRPWRYQTPSQRVVVRYRAPPVGEPLEGGRTHKNPIAPIAL